MFSNIHHIIGVQTSSVTPSPVKLDDAKLPWMCDKCKVARFRTFDEAEAHEEICTGVFDPVMFLNAAGVKREKKEKVKASDKKK